MISFFRRALSSWIVLGLLGLIMVAFIVTGIGTPGGLDQVSGASGETIATVGDERITSTEATQKIQLSHQNVQQERPDVDIASFVRQGGADEVIRQLVSGRAVEAWARELGFAASKRLVDGEIASIPAFKGPTGQFDEGVFRATLAQRRISEAQLRRDIEGDAIRRQILMPAAAGTRASAGVVRPYAELMLELRRGEIGIVPTAAIPAGPAPTDAELNIWYSGNLARYTLPERRVLRYALIGRDQLKTPVAPTDAEIQAAYKANAAQYGARETRSFSQVVLPDEAAARALAARIKGGASFADAAKQAGFTPADTALGEQTQQQIAALASAEIARAAFATPQGGTTQPMKSALGWHVLHVDAINRSAGRPLAAVREEIAATLEKQKADEALADLIAAIEDEVADGASFDEVVKARGLTAVSSAPVTASGRVPGSTSPVDPVVQALVKTGFEMSGDDDPSVETLGNGELHALLKVGQVIPAAPLPLAQIRERVSADFVADRNYEKARAVAKAIEAKLNRGVRFAKAIAETGLKLPAPQPAGGRQIDIARSGQRVPPPLAMMFSMKKGTARLLAAPGEQGWFVVKLDSVEKGDIAQEPAVLEAARREFDQVMSEELVQQFAAAAEKSVGVKRNDAVIKRLKAQLSGGGQ